MNPADDYSIEHIRIWYRSLTSMRRRVFDRFKVRKANFVDPLAALKLFGPEFSAPIEMVYPHSTNVVFPGSDPVDQELMPLPEAITKQIVLVDHGQKMAVKPRLHETVYYASTLFKGHSQCSEQETKSWRLMSAFFRPFLKTILYSHDPHVVVGRMSKMIVDYLATSKVNVRMLNEIGSVFESERPDAYFDFHQIRESGCDLCMNASQYYTKEGLRSVSSLSLRSTKPFQELLEREKDSFAGYLRLRDWSEYRMCRSCFNSYFPERAWQ
jgi:hypothetical protein